MKLTDEIINQFIIEQLSGNEPTQKKEPVEEKQGFGTALSRKGKDVTFDMDRLSTVFRIDEKTLGSDKKTYDRKVMEKYVQSLNLPTSNDPFEFVKLRLEALTEKSLSCKNNSAASKVTALSYLNSLKLVLSDFSPQGAGFIAEGFLSALFNAEQVPPGSGGIEDLLTLNRVGDKKLGISLKYFSSEKAKVKGSIASLFETLGIPFLMPSYAPASINFGNHPTTPTKEDYVWKGENWYRIYNPSGRKRRNLIYLVGALSKDGESVSYNISPVINDKIVVDSLIKQGLIEKRVDGLPCAFKFTSKDAKISTAGLKRNKHESRQQYGDYQSWLERDKQGKATTAPKEVDRQMKFSTEEFMANLTRSPTTITLPLGASKLNNIANQTMKDLWTNLKAYENWFTRFVGNLVDYTTSFDKGKKATIDENSINTWSKLPELVDAFDNSTVACQASPEQKENIEKNEKITEETLDKLIEAVILTK